MYDPLLEEDPWVQEYGEKREAEGEVKATRQNIEMIVQIRFPDLADPVMKRVRQLQDPMALQAILITLGLMSGDDQTRRYLQSL